MRMKAHNNTDVEKDAYREESTRGRSVAPDEVRCSRAPRADDDRPCSVRTPRVDGERTGAGAAHGIVEVLLLAMVPLAMGVALVAGFAQTALFMLLVVTVVLALFFAGYEAGKPALRQIMPTLVLAALAAAGRILFAPIPDFKPVSAIAIIAGATLGRRNGFMVGALAALASNFFFGQGMWSPWQMYAWGLIGYIGGVLADAGVLPGTSALHRCRVEGPIGPHAPVADRAERPGWVRVATLAACGLLSGLLYGVIINAYGVLGFVRPLTVPGAVAYVAASLPFDALHGVATAVFLVVLYDPWTRRIKRVVRKFDLRND